MTFLTLTCISTFLPLFDPERNLVIAKIFIVSDLQFSAFRFVNWKKTRQDNQYNTVQLFSLYTSLPFVTYWGFFIKAGVVKIFSLVILKWRTFSDILSWQLTEIKPITRIYTRAPSCSPPQWPVLHVNGAKFSDAIVIKWLFFPTGLIMSLSSSDQIRRIYFSVHVCVRAHVLQLLLHTCRSTSTHNSLLLNLPAHRPAQFPVIIFQRARVRISLNSVCVREKLKERSFSFIYLSLTLRSVCFLANISAQRKMPLSCDVVKMVVF